MANCVSIASALIVLEFASIFYQIDSIGKAYCYCSTCCTELPLPVTNYHCLGTILHHPQSRLVPVGVEVAFTCIVRDGLNPHWVINGQALSFRDSIERISAEEGFIIQRQETTDHASSLSLMFNTTMEKNGTTIYCSSFNTHSDEAILLVMSGKLKVINHAFTYQNKFVYILETPLIPNPLITNPNKSSVLLKWSPPFLWPGSVIDHYLVSVVAAEESDTFYHVNATFSDAVVSFLKTSGNATEIRNCNEILFCISAITDNGTELASFTVVGGYLPSIIHHRHNNYTFMVYKCMQIL